MKLIRFFMKKILIDPNVWYTPLNVQTKATFHAPNITKIVKNLQFLDDFACTKLHKNETFLKDIYLVQKIWDKGKICSPFQFLMGWLRFIHKTLEGWGTLFNSSILWMQLQFFEQHDLKTSLLQNLKKGFPQKSWNLWEIYGAVQDLYICFFPDLICTR